MVRISRLINHRSSLDNMKRLLVPLVLIALIITSLTASVFSVTAESAEAGSFDDSYVVDDLLTAMVDGQPFDPDDFPAVAGAQPQILSFQEYGYSYYADENQDLFGLYIYVYNPGQKTISSTTRNKISIAVGYDETGKPNDYEKFTLVLCNRSADEYSNLYYKFRIADPSGKIKARVATTPLERRYDVAEIELDFGDDNAAAYGVGGTFRFTGYATGLGPADDTDESTLRCDVTDLETITLDVHHSVYRTDLDNHTMTSHNQINTAYFAIPNRLLEQYGKLQKIKAEWYEYRTSPIYVTADSSFYNFISDQVNNEISDIHSCEYDYGFGSLRDYNAVDGRYYYDWTYNVFLYGGSYGSGVFSDSQLNEIFWSIYQSDISAGVDADSIIDYLYSYDNGDFIDVNGRQFSSDLINTNVGDGRIAGYNNYEFDADDDAFDFKYYDPSLSGWDKLLEFFGIYEFETDPILKGVAPIYIVKNDDIADRTSISDRLLISSADTDNFVNFVTTANANDCSVVLFRFANTEYYSKWLDVYKYNEHTFHTASVPDNIAFVAQQNIFLDFDIIQLTFNNDGDYTVIPAVSDPVDVISDIDTPAEPDDPISQVQSWFDQLWDKIVDLWNKLVAALGDFETNWWKYLLVALAIIIGVPIAFYLIKTIITLPWKLIKQHERNQRSKKYRR